MPRRNDLSSVLVIGSGPIVIGQACEFDYSGTQACRVLKEEGLRVILVNSNPATIMTDPGIADATYVEPITPEVVASIIEKERPDALLPTLGGQTALNTAVALAEMGVLERFNVELIGASIDAIRAGEDREEFKEIVERSGAEVARSFIAHTMEECHAAAAELGELPSRLNTNEKLNRVPDQRGSFTDPSEFLGTREQVIIECHSGSHSYLHIQDSIINSII